MPAFHPARVRPSAGDAHHLATGPCHAEERGPQWQRGQSGVAMPEAKEHPAMSAWRASIVCDDEETSRLLTKYLLTAGTRARATHRLAEAWQLDSAGEALVLLPDDFDAGEVSDGLLRVLSRSPTPLVIIITAVPQHFEPLIKSSASPNAVVILPKPIWGWTVLELLRNGSESGT